MTGTRIAKSYVVEVASCDSDLIVHGWEVAAVKEDDVIACKGRVQAVACYELWITILATDPADFKAKGTPMKQASPCSGYTTTVL